MKFTADYAGSITGVRFYKAAANTGTHVGQPVERVRGAAGAGDVLAVRARRAGST